MPRHNDDLALEAERAVADHPAEQHDSLKYQLLGPSLTKSGQDGVDQTKVSEIIYNASKGSKFFNNEEARDKNLTIKIDQILARKQELQRIEAAGGLKSDLKRADDYLSLLESERDLSQTIVHIDCDAFYAAVEELDNPELKDKPFAVGKGVLTTCNYIARKYGCRSGMAGFVADKLCPGLIHIPLNFDKYNAKAKEVREVLERYDPRFESASIDEAYLNLTEYCSTHAMQPEDAVKQLRDEVFKHCKITVSAGIAANSKLAKICSNQNKPNGQFLLASERTAIMAFMKDLPTRRVNGIGRVFERELAAIGIATCGDIYPQRHYLSSLFGVKAFQFLMGVYIGLGRTDVRPAEEHERKSVGTESTFHDCGDPHELRKRLRSTAEELEADLKRTEFKGKTLVLKVKLHTYEVLSRQVQPPRAVYTANDLYHFALPMLVKLEKEIPGMKLRLMGLRCTNLISTKKSAVGLFGKVHAQQARGPRIEVDKDGWQKWPDEEFEKAARQEKQDDMDELERLSQEYAIEATKSTSNKLPSHHTLSGREKAPQKELWSCPVCNLPQQADETVFNKHIDDCLSKQTIKELVKTEANSGKRNATDGTGRETKRRKPWFTR
ncbi:DNA/RNA polymerase [Piedraia hortae CBS 480.64]|uniref:DNA polymerase kappa n=1 Tax=Piedraia hortae CBS 480.64 TaxID=1314780 RepID=A0A6A7C9Z4_9PEZI|nr:DNA/RNA polymerase [Piedraia hortae CBS 480.64]